MKFVFFSVSENGENGLGDEGADGGNAHPEFFGLEPPLYLYLCVKLSMVRLADSRFARVKKGRFSLFSSFFFKSILRIS